MICCRDSSVRELSIIKFANDPITFSLDVNRICMPGMEFMQASLEAFMISYGYVDEMGETLLKEVNGLAVYRDLITSRLDFHEFISNYWCCHTFQLVSSSLGQNAFDGSGQRGWARSRGGQEWIRLRPGRNPRVLEQRPLGQGRGRRRGRRLRLAGPRVERLQSVKLHFFAQFSHFTSGFLTFFSVFLWPCVTSRQKILRFHSEIAWSQYQIISDSLKIRIVFARRWPCVTR